MHHLLPSYRDIFHAIILDKSFQCWDKFSMLLCTLNYRWLFLFTFSRIIFSLPLSLSPLIDGSFFIQVNIQFIMHGLGPSENTQILFIFIDTPKIQTHTHKMYGCGKTADDDSFFFFWKTVLLHLPTKAVAGYFSYSNPCISAVFRSVSEMQGYKNKKKRRAKRRKWHLFVLERKWFLFLLSFR